MCGVPRREIYYYLRSHLLPLLLQDEAGICTRQKSRQGEFEEKYGVLNQICGDRLITWPIFSLKFFQLEYLEK